MTELIRLTSRFLANYGGKDMQIWINPNSISSIELRSTAVYHEYIITMHNGKEFTVHGKDQIEKLGITY